MADQTQRLEIATVKAEVGSNILYLFSNAAEDAQPIATESGEIRNLKQVIATIQQEGAEKISIATTIYQTPAAGLAATADGGIFLVQSASADEIYTVWKNEAGAAVSTGKTAISSEAIQDALAASSQAAQAAEDAADRATLRTAAFLAPASQPPVARDDGLPLQIGDTYFNTSDQLEYIYKQDGWVAREQQDIGNLPVATQLDDGDYLPLLQGGITKRFAASLISGLTKLASTITYIADRAGAVGMTVQRRLGLLPVIPQDFGAIGDGTYHPLSERFSTLAKAKAQYPHALSLTDSIDWCALVAALNSGAPVVNLPATNGYWMTYGISVPRGVELCGDAIFCENYQGAGPRGSKLIFESAVPLCVHVTGAVGSSDASGTPGLRRVIVTRNGTIPAGAEGVRVSGAYNSTLEDVFSDRHAKGFRFLGKGSSTDPLLSGGLACNAARLFTGAITDAHFEIDSWPELRVTGGRSGMNGTGNLAGTCFVRITSPQGGNGGSGPNTIVFVNYQFNQGQVGPAYWLEFINNTAGVGNQVIYEFANCHVENISAAYIKSHANSPYIQKLQVTGGTLNTAVPLFDLDPLTTLANVTFNGVDIAASTLILASLYVNGLKFDACGFIGTIASLTAPTSKNWVISLCGNTWQSAASLTISGSGWSSCIVNDVFSFDSSVTDNSGSKNVYITSIKRNLGSWIPALQIGGESTGVSYVSTNGVYQLVGRVVYLNFRIALSSKGALTGPVTIGNLPFPPAGNSLDAHSGSIGYAQNFTALTGALQLRVQNTTKLEIRQSSENGNASLTEANLANNTFVTGSISYAI
nr:hypothetical protein [uncultured Pseudomonas sp.]